MMRSFSRFQGLNKYERLTLLRAGVGLLLVRLALAVFGFNRVYRFLTRQSVRRILLPDTSSERVMQTARMLEVAAYYVPFRVTCLSRSLVLRYLLLLQNVESKLCIGIRKKDGEFQAHAWIEYGEDVLNDHIDNVRSYTPIVETADLNSAVFL